VRILGYSAKWHVLYFVREGRLAALKVNGVVYVEAKRVSREVPTKVGQSEALGYSFATALYAERQSTCTNPVLKGTMYKKPNRRTASLHVHVW
jgi:hypothetical protein